MVSRTPTKAPAPRPSPAKPSPSPATRRRQAFRAGRRLSATKRRASPLKSLAAAPAAVASSFDRSVRFCRRRLFKLFARLAVFGSPTKRRAAAAGFQRLRSTSAPPPTPSVVSSPRSQRPGKVHPAALPPPTDPTKKTLFLDLDETLIHSQTDPVPDLYDFTVHPVICGQAITFYVRKRPGVDAFLHAAADAFEVVVFTAGLEQYASLVLDRLDPAGDLIAHRLYRGACRDGGDGRLVKDLSATGRPLGCAIIVDDNPNAYALQPENALPVVPFIDDDDDKELQKVMGFLDVAAGFDDTRDALRCYKDLLVKAK
ncbi:probable C-terminal domain small phosphatase [Lolium rigidum]|uniref:probable C-terminal domain small phosphatase n=1 Tax=Lolium rigidum TaxID=89674 RepID=UPI001F5C1DD3|nr:probable C-terminal domain small phosphatase [Lolium rigidum]